MKKRSRKQNVWLVGLMIAMLLCGCGASDDKMMAADSSASAEVMQTTESYDMNGLASGGSGDYMTDAAETEETVVEEPAMEAEDGGSAALENTVASNRKLIRRINMQVETQDFDGLTSYIESKVSELGGYMESSDVYGGSYEYNSRRNAHYTVRVPVDQVDALVGAVSGQANVTNKNESATDVTLTYVDTKSRKEAYQTEYDRLFVLLEKAEDIDTIVALESRMTTVRYEIQSLESQLRTYDNLVDYATVTIGVTEVVVYTPTEPEKKTDLERMTEGFKNSLENIAYDIKEFAIDFVIDLPYLIIWAVIITIIVLVIKKIRKRRKAKKEKQNADRKENGVCDTDRTTECGEINTDEPADRTENSDHVE